MIMKLSWLIISIPVLLTLNSCHQDSGGETNRTIVEDGDLSGVRGEITISREQFESMKMEVGNPGTTMFSNSLSVNGYIVAAPSGRAKITSLISGRVRQINVSPGDNVRNGQILFSLESHEIILLQQEYAEAVQHLELLRAD